MEHVIPRDVLKQKLYQVNFHTTLSGEAMVTMIYHKQLNEEWKAAALDLRSVLSSCPSCPNGNVSVIGRSKKQKVELDRSYVDEVMTVDSKHYSYRQVEGAFSQPNGGADTCCMHHLASLCFCLYAEASPHNAYNSRSKRNSHKGRGALTQLESNASSNCRCLHSASYALHACTALTVGAMLWSPAGFLLNLAVSLDRHIQAASSATEKVCIKH